MAFDHPDAVARLAVMDVIPIAEAWRQADSRLTLSFWPWSLLAQPAPLPERLISASPEAIIEDAANHWGTEASCIPAEIREAYAEALSDPRRVHAICEEFRSAAVLDRQHDESDQSAGRRINCPLLVLWDANGALDKWYRDQGGPIGIWQDWALDVSGKPVAGGHFFPEACPEMTADELRSFFLGD